MTKPPLADVPVRSAEELTHRWHTLLEPPVFGARSLWLTWFDDGLMLPVVIPVDDVPDRPDCEMLTNLVHVCESVAESHVSGECHVAMALCRQGSSRVTKDDEAWAAGLRRAFQATDGTWSLHLAAGGRIGPVVEAPASTWASLGR
jgi:hypothetical protein